MPDRYPNFATLSKHEKLGADYQIWFEDLNTPIIVLAPHGGWIEPGSSHVAKAIARLDYSVYLFEGLRNRPHCDLHITSTRFDEPQAEKLIKSSATAIAVHGRTDEDSPRIAWLGGRNTLLRDKIFRTLVGAGFKITVAEGNLAGREPNNICNRGTSGGGVQLELPRTLRNELSCDTTMLQMFSDAVRKAILITQAEI